jgi:hypothetical protein
MSENRNPFVPGDTGKVSHTQHIPVIEVELMSHGLKKPPSGKYFQTVTENQIMGGLTRKSHAGGGCMEKAVGPLFGQGVQVGG